MLSSTMIMYNMGLLRPSFFFLAANPIAFTLSLSARTFMMAFSNAEVDGYVKGRYLGGKFKMKPY